MSKYFFTVGGQGEGGLGLAPWELGRGCGHDRCCRYKEDHMAGG